MDKKSTIIVVLCALVILLIFYIGAIKFNKMQELAFQQGLRQGQLLEQRNAISQIQASGIYTIAVINENNETQIIRLGLVQQGNFPLEPSENNS